jgi:hypothetical protein
MLSLGQTNHSLVSTSGCDLPANVFPGALKRKFGPRSGVAPGWSGLNQIAPASRRLDSVRGPLRVPQALPELTAGSPAVAPFPLKTKRQRAS